MDVAFVIRKRLKELALDQKDLAAAVQVTESYISQLLARKKAPPAPGRTALYERISSFLKLPSGELSKIAELQRQAELIKRSTQPPPPLFRECRDLIIRKCENSTQDEVRPIFEKEIFGPLERLVTQKLLDVAKRVASEELESKDWLHLMAELSGRSYEQMRVLILEFLEVDVFNVSLENWVSFLEPLIHSWDIHLETFSIEIVLNGRLAPGSVKRFEFVEKEPQEATAIEPGLADFLGNAALSGDATEEEIRFLKDLKFTGQRRPTHIYYYRELQNLRDPFHFRV